MKLGNVFNKLFGVAYIKNLATYYDSIINSNN